MNYLKTSLNNYIAEKLDINYISEYQLLEILKGYLEAALWTEEEILKDSIKSQIEEDEEDYDDEIEKIIKLKNKLNNKSFKNFLIEDIEENSRIQAYLDIKDFIKKSGEEAIEEAIRENGEFELGMNIWLSRNHHGAGFFDYNYDNEKILTDTAHSLKEVELYVNDDYKLQFSNSH
jgi:hypothetical protein